MTQDKTLADKTFDKLPVIQSLNTSSLGELTTPQSSLPLWGMTHSSSERRQYARPWAGGLGHEEKWPWPAAQDSATRRQHLPCGRGCQHSFSSLFLKLSHSTSTYWVLLRVEPAVTAADVAVNVANQACSPGPTFCWADNGHRRKG